MISKSIGGKTKQKWELCPEQLTLEQALEILNPDNKDYIGNKRGAYKRVVNVLQCLGQIENANPSEALEELEQDIKGRVILAEDRQLKLCAVIKQALIKAQEQEKENEILKEIIKSLFDEGCPLHQYTDKEGTLTIEVDNECSTMRLGQFKGVDLDKKLKEVLE